MLLRNFRHYQRSAFRIAGNRHTSRQMTTTTSTSAATPKSSFEAEEAPLFSLRTRLAFYSSVASAVLFWSASFWLSLDRENIYRAYELYPEVMKVLGSHLGVPTLSNGEIDTEALGPRDVRDLVGKEVLPLTVKLADGSQLNVDALALESLDDLRKKLGNFSIAGEDVQVQQ